jgi:shikimate dehydrogenase
MTPRPQRCFIAGSPVSQSRSPMIHGHWFAAHGVDATYERIETTPDQLPALLARVRSGELLGGNLTIPLKEAVVPLLDRLTPEAAAMGAVNTVYRDGEALCGANTDVPGYFAHLDETAPGWDDTPVDVLVLGAGGAGRAIAWGLLRRRVGIVTLANRSRARAEAIAASLADPRLRVADWPVDPALLGSVGLIINTTSLGMSGQPALELDWPERLDGVIVSDVVYKPLETGLLSEGAARGAKPVDGLGMLLQQAAIAFGIWFGTTPRVTPALRALVEADLLAAG